MNQIVRCRRIIGVFILIFAVSIFVFLPSEVFAATKKECKNYLTNTKFISRYNANITTTGSKNKYKISIEPTSSDKKLEKALRKVIFKVIKINDKNQDGSKTVSYGKPLTINGQYFTNDLGEKEMSIVLESTEKSVDPKCTGTVTFTLGVTTGGDEIVLEEDIPTIEDQFGDVQGKLIDCTKTQTEAFEKAFCETKNAALKADPDGTKGLNYSGKFNGHKNFKDVVKGENGELGYKKLQCSATKFEITNDYYVNKTHLYGYGEYTENFGNYTYHYSPGVVTQGENINCKVRCEEAVVVEYGPPVASKAGLCFEYKVKVTSRVSCNMIEKPKTPKTTKHYCTPTPICLTSAGTYTNQGGPSEEFDSCVKTCDGGKYTDKCTKKCYQKVYGDSATKTTTRGKEYLTEQIKYGADAFSLQACKNESGFHGCYYRAGNSILWEGVSSSTPGRWYLVSPHKDLSAYGVFGNGIYRHIYGEGNYCHDNCWWSGCSDSNVYLNPGISKKDYENNKELYDTAVAQCKVEASCTTTTADFTISVNYKNGKNEVKTLDFPYTTKKDKMTSKGSDEKIEDTNKNNDTTILCADRDPLTGKCNDDKGRGCYSTKDAKRIYMTEWSFPGSWINNKSGEISYVPKDDKSWQTMKNKFCIPLDAQDVNVKWWNYRQLKNPNYSQSSASSSAYVEKCVQNGYGIQNISTFSNSDVEDWNINAKTSNFGYFGWNIHVSCFYALNTGKRTTTSTNTNSSVPKECLSDASYRIRSVDLANLFPATDGSVSESRAPGFNWSEYATKTKANKDPANDYYEINPAKYATFVASKAQAIYSDEYLDYSIDLTRDMIAKLRKDSKSNNYSTYANDDEYFTKNYVINYRSPLFKNGGALSSSSKYPTLESLKCNNMKNYNSGCEEFGGND